MKRKALGFYWTLPVPWAGFTRIAVNDVESAARQSRTIALQRRAVQAHARYNGYDLVHEAAHIEIEPDRGGEEIAGELAKLVAMARKLDARILFVDFGQAIHQRSHQFLGRFVSESEGLFQLVSLDWTHEVAFVAHFSSWRDRQEEWTAAKPARLAAARARALELKAQGHKNPAIAEALEAEGLRSATGKPWTADSLRKALAGT